VKGKREPRVYRGRKRFSGSIQARSASKGMPGRYEEVTRIPSLARRACMRMPPIDARSVIMEIAGIRGRRHLWCRADRPAGDEPLESGAGTLRAACPTLGRQERRITGGAAEPPRHRSAKCPRLDHDRRRRRRHHAPAFAARAACWPTCRLLHRRPAGGLAGLSLRGRTGRGTSRTRRAELHERRATAAVRTAKTTAAARSGCEAAQGNHEAQGTGHDWDLHHRRAEEAPQSDTMRRPRRRLPKPSSRSAARSDRRLTFSKKFLGRPRPFPPTLPMAYGRSECAGWPGPSAVRFGHAIRQRSLP
jgi:hypothetical protein